MKKNIFVQVKILNFHVAKNKEDIYKSINLHYFKRMIGLQKIIRQTEYDTKNITKPITAEMRN